MARLSRVASGLAASLPAMSGAEPCTGSYSALRRPSASGAPSEADGSMPSEPVSIAAQVVGDNDVELLGLAHQLHGAVVGVHVAELDIGVFGLVQRGHFLAPQH